MAGTVFLCCTDHRRAALGERPDLNGIDFLEVGNLDRADLEAPEQLLFDGLDPARQDLLVAERKLTVAFVNPLLPAHNAALDDDSLRLDGGERADSRDVRLSIVARTGTTLVLRATRRGDFSPYRLSIIESPTHPVAPQGFDPMLAAVDFSFKVDCPSEFDCAPGKVCPPAERPTIDIDYLARDYQTFRRLMLDRMSALSPGWRERHAADLGVAMVELVSYVADHLAYRQESVGTEAYLKTARKRVSVRRHARLVDYSMHDGCNARAWIQILLDKDVPPDGITLTRIDPVTQRPIRFLTGLDAAGALDPAEADALLIERHPEVFEPFHDVVVYPAHARFDFYTWGASECCLPQGATRATLRGHHANLVPNTPLLLEEVVGAEFGRRADRDLSHRHVVRLTRVDPGVDPLGGRFDDPPNDGSVDITDIEWDQDDALPFPFCVAAPTRDEDGDLVPTVIGLASGNLVLADHGMTIGPESLGAVADSTLTAVQAASAATCAPDTPVKIPARYRPELARGPLTQAGRVAKSEVRNGRASTSMIPFDVEAPASHAARWAMSDVVPEIELTSCTASFECTWQPRRDLLNSAANARDFVVECESDGTARIRFGDERLGTRPPAGTSFVALYRVGNGARGNVGAEAIAHVARTGDGVVRVRNPLAASGGIDAESIEDVRRFAPVAFRTQQRAVTTDDYARRAELHPQVQKAAATFRWTGSWRTVYVTADPRGGPVGASSLDPALPIHLEPYRMAGHDIDVDAPRYVPLEIDMQVCAKPEYFRSDVKQALLDLFSSRRLPDGRTGIFHPDNFTFGQPLYLSRLYASAFEVAGVESVTISTFQRQGVADALGLERGKLTFARLEIARLDNDRDFPERGVFRLTVEGGK